MDKSVVREIYVDIFNSAVNILSQNRNEKRAYPSLADQLHACLVHNVVFLPTEFRVPSLASCRNWLTNVKAGRYTYADANNGIRCGRTGAGGR
jgi:hypothetical protein